MNDGPTLFVSLPERDEANVAVVATDDQLRATAYHEAGHGLIARMRLHRWSFLAVFADGGGSCEMQRDYGASRDDDPLGYAAYHAGGVIAEERFTGEPVRIAGSDLDGLDALCAAHPRDRRFRARAERLAGELLALHWRDVERVAEALLERGHLEPLGLAGLIGSSRRRRARV